MRQMSSTYFNINVSKNGQYFTDTDIDGPGSDHAYEVFQELQRRFPAEDGYRVTVTKWESLGHSMKW